jgi:hypothetical protein
MDDATSVRSYPLQDEMDIQGCIYYILFREVELCSLYERIWLYIYIHS